jgi:hypothetical protein
MEICRVFVGTRVVIGSALAVGMLLFPSPSSGQVAGPAPQPKQRSKNSVAPPQHAAGRLDAAPSAARGPGQRAEGRRLNARRGVSQGDQVGDRRERPGGQSAVDQRSGNPVGPLLQGGFDLRLVSWGVRSGVPTSGKKLVILGIDNNDLLHIRIFDAGGKSLVDTDETKLSSAQAVAIAMLKQQLPGLLPPHVLTGAQKGRVIRKVILIVAQTSQDPQQRLRQVQPRERSVRSRTTRSRSGRDASSSPTSGLSTGPNEG